MKGMVVVVDDDPLMADMVREMAARAGWDARSRIGAEVLNATLPRAADVIILDLLMPGIDGVEVMRRLAEGGCRSAFILMSGMDHRVLRSAEDMARAHGLSVLGSLTKPFAPADLTALLVLAEEREEGRGGGAGGLRKAGPPAPVTAEDVRTALADGAVQAAFQAQVGVEAGHLPCGAEALARWTRPDGEAVPPDVFVPVIEAAGLSRALAETMLDQAVAACTGWPEQMRVAVNLSAGLLDDVHLPDWVVDRLRVHGLPPHRLVLEITESAAMPEQSLSLDVLTRLRLRGIGLSIDDFGTGFSTMKQLAAAPFTELKIDRSFIYAMDRGADGLSMVTGIISLASSLGLEVVAEGVETAGQARRLHGLGCQILQGYHFGRPMPAKAFRDWLEAVA